VHRAPPKNKKEDLGVVSFYKQATPLGFENQSERHSLTGTKGLTTIRAGLDFLKTASGRVAAPKFLTTHLRFS
jgi:phage-related protein